MKQAATNIPVYSGSSFHEKGLPGNFYVDCFEKANIWQLSPHRRTFYQVIFFREGTGRQLVDFKLFLSDGPALVLLSPNQVHQMDISTDARGHLLMLPESFFALDNRPEAAFGLKDVFDNIQCFPFLQLDPAAASLLDGIIRQIQHVQQNGGSMQSMILLSYVKIFLLHVYQLREQVSRVPAISSHSGERQFREFKTLVEQHYRSDHQLNAYAKKLHISLKHLNMLCRKHGNTTAGHLLQQRILLEAQRYLYHGTIPVKELAYLLGFADPAYFNRFFKKQTGMAPGLFRKNMSTGSVNGGGLRNDQS